MKELTLAEVTEAVKVLVDGAYARGVADENARILGAIGGEKAPRAKTEEANRWTREEDAVLETLWTTTNLTAEEVGRQLGRTAGAVYTRVKHREIPGREDHGAGLTRVQGAPGPKEPEPPLPEPGKMLDAALLPPLTALQAKAFRGLVLAVAENANGETASFSQINRLGETSGVSSYTFKDLAKLGYVEMRGSFGAPDWRPVAEGEPREKTFTDGDGNQTRQWTEKEIAGLRALDPASGETYLSYAKKIGRTEIATKQKARSILCYRKDLESTYASGGLPGRWPEKKPGEENPPAPLAPPTAVGNPDDGADEADEEEADVDLDDLSKAPREVLIALRHHKKMGLSVVREPDIFAVADVDAARVPFALTRLSELKLISSNGDRAWSMTPPGERLAEKIAEEDRST